MMKKQLIMEKALELFAKQGFEATSVQQITEQCGISKGAFYLSFKSKDELILSLIDHFMMQITSDIDYVVKNKKKEELLYEFYYVVFSSFYKYSDFTKIFVKEQTHSFNQEFILKIHYYDSLIEKTILSMIERLYGSDLKTKYDMIYSIKGFMNIYSQLFLFSNAPFDLDLLSQSLVEKTNLLAKHASVAFFSEALYYKIKQPINEDGIKEQILGNIDNKIDKLEESIEKESLLLLKQQMLESTFSPAIVKGLLGNIRHHPECRWISYLLRSYFKM
ncbi:TetR/AcrR family transcriptional regulator [Niallia sp. 03133]|uniref:TetR/AcrR family transcriptional regulator n=1 Tax=Niallia sp. 03133 TaxID=3458060 RepID=UPI0040443E9B